MSKLMRVYTPLGRNSSTYRIGGYVGHELVRTYLRREECFARAVIQTHDISSVHQLA